MIITLEVCPSCSLSYLSLFLSSCRFEFFITSHFCRFYFLLFFLLFPSYSALFLPLLLPSTSVTFYRRDQRWFSSMGQRPRPGPKLQSRDRLRALHRQPHRRSSAIRPLILLKPPAHTPSHRSSHPHRHRWLPHPVLPPWRRRRHLQRRLLRPPVRVFFCPHLAATNSLNLLAGSSPNE